MGQLAESIVVSAFAAFFASWLTAQFALRRFQHEKIWERKAAAYSVIFEALHDMGRWFDEHWRSIEGYTELSDQRKEQLAADYQSAKALLARRLDSETWLIPQVCRERLERMTDELRMRSVDNWVELVDRGGSIIAVTVNELRDLVREDLGLKRRPSRLIVIVKRYANRSIFGQSPTTTDPSG